MKLGLLFLAIFSLLLVVLWQPKQTEDSLGQAQGAVTIRNGNRRNTPSILPSSTSRRLGQAESIIENDKSEELIEVNRAEFSTLLSKIDPFNRGDYTIPQFWKDWLGLKDEKDATTLSRAIADIVNEIKHYDIEHAIALEAEGKPEAAIWLHIPAVEADYLARARTSLAGTLASLCDNQRRTKFYISALEPMWSQVSQERIIVVKGPSTGRCIIDNIPREPYFIGASHF